MIYNEYTFIFETLIRENPRRFIQKQLNHSAIRVKALYRWSENEIFHVYFPFINYCPENRLDILARCHSYESSLRSLITQEQTFLYRKDQHV